MSSDNWATNALRTCMINEDISVSLEPCTIGVLGYASQGRAQALNLRDEGLRVIVGARKRTEDSSSWETAKKDGFVINETLFEIHDAVRQADIVLFLVADVAQPQVYKKDVESFLKEKSLLVFAHGFNVHNKYIIPHPGVDVTLLAPQAPGAAVRSSYISGEYLFSLVGVYQDVTGSALEKTYSIAKSLKLTKGVVKTTFEEETTCNLFLEQSVLAGMTSLVTNSFETLIGAGYNPVVAYFELHYQLYGLLAPLAHKHGNYGMLEKFSLNARKGVLEAGENIISRDVNDALEKQLEYIRKREFAQNWKREYDKSSDEKLTKELKEKLKQRVQLMHDAICAVDVQDEKMKGD